jgi:WD40 repeat protein
MMTMKKIVTITLILLLTLMVGCIEIKQDDVLLETPTALVTETQIATSIPISTLTPFPSSTPELAYSYLPVISSSNVTEISDFDTIGGQVSSIAFSPNGKYIAASFDNGAGLIWDISTVKGWREWRDAQKDVFFSRGIVSFNADSTVLATGGTLIDLSTKNIIQELPGSLVAFNLNGKTLALYERDTVSLWDFDGNQWTRLYSEETGEVAEIAFSPDGSLLAEAMYWGDGEGVNIWKVADHTLLYSFLPPDHSHPAHFNTKAEAFLAFSPDNQLIATGTKDQPVIRIWDLRTGKLVKDLNTVVEIDKQDPSSGKTITEYYIPDVEAIAFSKDSSVLAVAGDDTVMLRALPNGELKNMLEIDPYNVSSAYITAFAMSPDGKLLVAGDSGGNVRFWGVPTSVP